MSYNKLPADPTSLVLGIIALVLGIAGCCCYGISAIVPLGLGIVGLVMANKSLREYYNNPDVYSPASKSNVSTAKVINIIAVVFNGVLTLVAVAIFAIYGSLFSAAFLEEMRNGTYDEYEWEEDSEYKWEEDDYIIEEEVDSVKVDSIRVDEEGVETIEIEEN